jgi:hypothetical protein
VVGGGEGGGGGSGPVRELKLRKLEGQGASTDRRGGKREEERGVKRIGTRGGYHGEREREKERREEAAGGSKERKEEGAGEGGSR